MEHRFKYAYYDLGEQRQGNVVVVRLGGPSANVLLLDPPNLARYRAGYRFSYIGGRYRSTAQLEIPRTVVGTSCWTSAAHPDTSEAP